MLETDEKYLTKQNNKYYHLVLVTPSKEDPHLIPPNTAIKHTKKKLSRLNY